MKRRSLVVVCILALLFILAPSFLPPLKKKRILVFSKTAGFRHASIADGKKALLKMAAENNFIADTTEDAAVFTDQQLRRYDVILFLNTTGNILDSAQQAAMEKFIRSGKGFAGLHAASDTEYDWPWFARLVGANFESHPKPQQATLIRADSTHIATRMLPVAWTRFDEWYNFKNINPDTHTLLKIDETSYTGGKNGAGHPMSWYHVYDGGRCFYTALGHTPESYTEPLFLAHILGGIKYAAGIK